MRIFILTDNEDRHYYFANRVIEETGCVVGVITGGKAVHLRGAERLRRRLRPAFLHYRIRNFLLNRLFRTAGRQLKLEKADVEKQWFGGAKERFERSHGALRIAHVDRAHRSLNDPCFLSLIEACRPDAIAVMGTCIVSKRIIGAAPLVLNLHTGLSPYYRGGYTNLFPFLENDFGFFGVTVHKMSPGIDAGDIVASERMDLRPGDGFSSINARCVASGTTLMVSALRYASRAPLPAVPQWETGKLFHARHFNNYVAHRYLSKRAEFVRRHLELQSQGRLPALRTVSLPNV